MNRIHNYACLIFFTVFFSLLSNFAMASVLIVGGSKVLESDPIAATTVALMINAKNDGQFKFHCTASILDQNILVTAAHCVCPNPKSAPPAAHPNQLKVVFGLEVKRPKQVIAISDIKVHPNYLGYLDADQVDMADIAIIKLASPLPDGYHAAKILDPKEPLLAGEIVTLAGYGRTSMDMFNTIGTLRRVNTTILNPNFGTSEIEIEQSNGQGACFGDSGGPAFVNINGALFLWGVTNHLYPQGINTALDCKHQIIYANINAHLDFIAKSIAEMQVNH